MLDRQESILKAGDEMCNVKIFEVVRRRGKDAGYVKVTGNLVWQAFL